MRDIQKHIVSLTITILMHIGFWEKFARQHLLWLGNLIGVYIKVHFHIRDLICKLWWKYLNCVAMQTLSIKFLMPVYCLDNIIWLVMETSKKHLASKFHHFCESYKVIAYPMQDEIYKETWLRIVYFTVLHRFIVLASFDFSNFQISTERLLKIKLNYTHGVICIWIQSNIIATLECVYELRQSWFMESKAGVTIGHVMSIPQCIILEFLRPT